MVPSIFSGDWCNSLYAQEYSHDHILDDLEEKNWIVLREQWASALLKGDFKTAHKLWGKWQGFSGNDPWDDEGWRKFWEIQRYGEKFWDDFDATHFEDKMLLEIVLSYWPGSDL